MRDALIDTARRAIRYRGFVIEEGYHPREGNLWEWTHDSFSLDAHGLTQTVFEAIDAVDAWYEQREAA